MKHSHTRALYDYWDSLRLSRSTPLRSELDPRSIKPMLTNMFILQRLSDAEYTYRLAGTAMCRQFGRELRDENFLDIWRDNEAASIRSLFKSITDDRTAAVLGVSVTYDDGTEATVEYLFLPVRLDSSHEIRIVGCCSQLDEPDDRAARTIVGHEIASLRLLWPENVSRFMEPATALQAAESVGNATPAPHRTAEQRGHLWVIEGGAK